MKMTVRKVRAALKGIQWKVYGIVPVVPMMLGADVFEGIKKLATDLLSKFFFIGGSIFAVVLAKNLLMMAISKNGHKREESKEGVATLVVGMIGFYSASYLIDYVSQFFK